MPPVNGKGMAQAVNNCFMHTTDNAGVIYINTMVGVIHRQSSKGRKTPPPPCRNGFDCGGTSFAYGHVMALELGGVDATDNIVPQYGQWQGDPRGAWRRMEVAIEAASPLTHQVMVVALEYAAVAETYAAQKQLFADGDKLRHWTDPRIPTRFQVWVTTANWVAGQVKMAEYLAANDLGKDAHIGALMVALRGTPPMFDEAITAMPGIDRDYWRGQMINALVRSSYAEYEAATTAAKQLVLRQATGAVHSGGKISRVGVNRTARLTSGPLPLKLPPDPLKMHNWVAQDSVRQGLADLLVNNTNGVSGGWTDIERGILTPQAITNAMFA